MDDKKYLADLRFSTQVTEDSHQVVAVHRLCDENTTVGEIFAWAKSKDVTSWIALELCEVEE